MLYIKKIINQDLERTPTFNVEAVRDFFKINLNNGESVEIKIILVPSNKEYIIRFQKRETRGEYRIFLNELLKDISPNEGDILLLNKVNPSTFTCEYIGMHNEAYNHYNHLFDFNSNHQLILNESLEQQEPNNKAPKNSNLNQILYGPPGTGKTYSTITIALNKIGISYNNYNYALEKFRNQLGNQISFVTMHPSFSYEDFIQGLKPQKSNEGNGLLFEYKDGVFKDICKRASENRELKYVIVLDEINRANISKVFGELISLIEEDKRDGNLKVTLPSGEHFTVPSNLYLIGTMNTADKSIALVDIALRRRFQFIPVYPNTNLIEDNEKKEFMSSLNKQLIDNKSDFYKGVDFQVGHAYFLKNNTLNEVINENIIPLLTEYFRNDLEKVKDLLISCKMEINTSHYNEFGLLKVD
jgi:hypothetical protein